MLILHSFFPFYRSDIRDFVFIKKGKFRNESVWLPLLVVIDKRLFDKGNTKCKSFSERILVQNRP